MVETAGLNLKVSLRSQADIDICLSNGSAIRRNIDSTSGEDMLLVSKHLPWQGSGQAEVADLDLAALIDKQVDGLDIPMNDIGRVEELNGARKVVQDG